MSQQSASDPAFQSIDPEWKGLLVWRVVKFNLEPVNDIGAFYSGDSYLVYHSYVKGNSKRVIQDVYFWIGSKTSVDERGTAALKAINLDDHFGGAPIQHRETQEHESDAFRELFEPFGGIRYMDGGATSGFKKIEGQTSIHMFHVKGKKNPVLQQVTATGHSLNQGDVFIVTAPGKFFLWIGKRANRIEIMKAANFLDGLRAKDTKAAVIRLEDGETTPEFWECLGGPTPIADASEAGDDASHEVAVAKQLFKVNGEAFELVAEGPAMKPNLLKSDGIFIIRHGNNIIAWIGKGIAKDNKKLLITIASKFIESQGLPDWCPISTLLEGTSATEFDIAFA